MIGQRSVIRLGWHWLKSFTAAVYYGFPTRKLQVIGVTGTDGKTTTVGMVHHILHSHGIAVGTLSTAFIRINSESEWNHTEKTSPSPFVIQKFLRRLVAKQCTHAVLEVSSHGLVQHRLNWTWPIIAGFTNIGNEHLDYHKTMEQYIQDKSLIFTKLRTNGLAVLNADDQTYKHYKQLPVDTVAFSVLDHPEASLLATNIKAPHIVSATITDTESAKAYDLQLQVPGAFNVENALCALLIAKKCGVPIKNACAYLQYFKNAPGRMEEIAVGQKFSVYIDFTVTPQAFKKTLTTLRQSLLSNQNKLLVLSGSCGDRMPEKRPLIGAICSDLADTFVVTDDEPYTEDPAIIRADILKGTNKEICNIKEIPDRREAIEWILRQAKPGDVVLLCGLGSYPSRMFGTTLVPWNEQEITTEVLQSLL